MTARSTYKRLQKAISRDDKHSIASRWEYGRTVLADPKKMAASGKSLRHGATEALIADASAVGTTLTAREIQRRIQFARAYATEAEMRQALTDFGDWFGLIEAGFPAVAVDETDELIEGIEAAGADSETQDGEMDPLFEIPGFKAVMKIRGRKVDLGDVTVREAIDYRDMCREMHANFGHTVAQIERSVELMIAGSGGDLDANALDAWRRATDEEAA